MRVSTSKQVCSFTSRLRGSRWWLSELENKGGPVNEPGQVKQKNIVNGVTVRQLFVCWRECGRETVEGCWLVG